MVCPLNFDKKIKKIFIFRKTFSENKSEKPSKNKRRNQLRKITQSVAQNS